MDVTNRLALFAIGLAAGAALIAASDPPPSGPARQDSRWNPGPAHTGHGPHGARHGGGHVDAAHAAGPEIGFRGCAFFEDEGFAGRRGELREGASVEWVGRAWNDRISSVACHPGCRLIGYVDINYGGQRRNLAGAVAALGPGWNDRISALRGVCDGAAPHDAREDH